MRIMKLFIAMLAITSAAHAETLYTSLQETIVRDKPVALGSTIIARLKPGTLVETIKPVGAFMTVSFIQDGKVRTGFIQSAHLNKKEGERTALTEAAQTTLGAQDVGGMINGLGSEPSPTKTAAAADVETELPPGSDDPASLLTSKLDSMQIPAKDLATFASNGKLLARKPKGR